MSEKNNSVPNPAESDDALKKALLFLQEPFGDGPSQGEHLRAVQYLLDHAASAHPYLLELLQSRKASNPYAVIEILPKFELRESIPVLEELVERGPTNLCQAAAHALALHPLHDALEALLRGLDLSTEERVIAAIDGLMTRGDVSVCEQLKGFLKNTGPNLRYHAIQAAAALGCVEPATLFAIAKDDLSEDIRELANRLLLAPHQGAKL